MRLLRLLVLALVASAPVAAFADVQGYAVQKDVGSGQSLADPDLTTTALSGCSNVAINSAVTCGGTTGFSVSGYNILTLFVSFTRAAATGDITFNLECDPGDGNFYVRHAGSISAGADTLSVLVPTKATGSASKKFEYSMGVNAKKCKITNLIVGGSAGTSDKATVYGILAVTPAA